MTNPIFDKYNLKGRKALVTGGGTGLGYHMARSLASLGATVMLASRKEDILKAAADKLMSEPQIGHGRVLYRVADLVDREQTRALAAHALAQMGGVDIFVGNAAQDRLQYIDAMPDSSIDEVVRINLQANMELTRAFLPHMRKQKWGRIIFSASVAGVSGSAHPGFSVYAATKGGLNAFTHTVAAECGRDGITVNSLVIGLFPTAMMMKALDDVRKEQGDAALDGLTAGIKAMMAVGRLGDASEIEGIIELLASNAGTYITGANLVIDGGLSSMFTPNPV